MCGILFVHQHGSGIGRGAFDAALRRQAWRGPDSTGVVALDDGNVLLGHNRLAIVDPLPRSNQPMRSACGRYHLVFNGEIYNHLALRRELGLECRTTSDTETVLEGFARIGPAILDRLDGMFALVIHDAATGAWVAARDRFGIKPLYALRERDLTAIASEPASLVSLRPRPVDAQSVQELRLVRRPLPGKSFFVGVEEVLPGHALSSDGLVRRFAAPPRPSADAFDQHALDELVRASVRAHEMSDVPVVSLLSGGLDAAIVTGLSTVERTYTVGLDENNEFRAAAETAAQLGKGIEQVSLSSEDLPRLWRELTVIRGEPLSVPNEALIYAVCKAMAKDEKVFLTGEGADELFFGYDKIFRWSLADAWHGAEEFLRRYGYSDTVAPTDRLLGYVEGLRCGKSVVEFVEDFFLAFHLPGLLRRMDFASMAASKEARVPFVTKDLLGYMYRRAARLRIDEAESKIPLRRLAASMNLRGALARPKIGFSATPAAMRTRSAEYQHFYSQSLEALGW